MTKQVQIGGTLSTRSGDAYPVRLKLTVKELRSGNAVEDETVSRVELDTCVPDGEYMLEYFDGNSFYGPVRVWVGALAMA